MIHFGVCNSVALITVTGFEEIQFQICTNLSLFSGVEAGIVSWEAN